MSANPSADHPAPVFPCTILPEAEGHSAAIDRLLDEAFGPGRFAKSAERLREGNRAIASACLVATDAEGLTGTVRIWPVDVDSGGQAAFLGPLAVAERARGNGLAFRLMEQAIAACAEAGFSAVVLVGDESYYARAGFRKAGRERFGLPGPVDPDRVLIRDLDEGAATLSGRLSVPRAATPAS
jgi:predicted N-acetyltransferase YhbS